MLSSTGKTGSRAFYLAVSVPVGLYERGGACNKSERNLRGMSDLAWKCGILLTEVKTRETGQKRVKTENVNYSFG